MNTLTPIQVRILGCLMEKKETTPEQYPLTLNALRNACNQKSSRFPVTNYSEGEVGHTIRELEAMDLVREEWGVRVPKYSHLASKGLDIHSQGIALICVLMLRGPQTLGELKIHSHRLFQFGDLEDVEFALQKLIDHEPSMVVALPRLAGQKEGRYAHLLSGEADIPAMTPLAASAPSTGLEARIELLELELEEMKQRLTILESS